MAIAGGGNFKLQQDSLLGGLLALPKLNVKESKTIS
jgi:hypothetical protein